MPNLYGIHDIEGVHVVPKGGWCVALAALSENPKSVDYAAIRSDVNWLVRLSWGYGSTGTFPLLDQVNRYVDAAYSYILSSKGVYGFILGNEPNHENERPNGVVIQPEHAALVYNKTRSLVKSANSSVRLLTPPIAPYHANPSEWLFYLKRMLLLIEKEGADGITLHAYVRGSRSEDIRSEVKMASPLLGQYASFKTYQDVLSVVPLGLRSLPAFITEFNELLPEGWFDSNTGVVKEGYQEIKEWNDRSGTQKIHCLALYRWPKYDKWAIEGKNGVIQDFAEAIRFNYQSPEATQTPTMPSKPVETHLPTVGTGQVPSSPSVPFERVLDKRALDRGVNFTEMSPKPGEPVWRVKSIRYLDPVQSQGRHHFYIDLRDSSGKRAVGKKVDILWSTGHSVQTVEDKNGPFGIEFGLSPGKNAFSALVLGDGLSEMVRGIGMGADTPGGFNPGEHTSTEVVFVKDYALDAPVTPPITPPSGGKITLPLLFHPVKNPAFRVITQIFGVNGDYYKKFSVDGVPLKGHNGVDYATPVNSEIVAVDNGRVAEVAYDPEGYGLYVKLIHSWGETLYAHLSIQSTAVGNTVQAGQVIGMSGNTGNSTGPHLHFGLRALPYNRKDGWGGYIDPLPFLGVPPVTSPVAIVPAIKAAGEVFGIEWQLLASLAWAESSFNPDASNGGLFQISDATWRELALRVGERDIRNPSDNAYVAGYYLRYLLGYYKDNLYTALTAYNWGLGNVDSGKKAPALTIEYVNKVLHGRDLLKAVGA